MAGKELKQIDYNKPEDALTVLTSVFNTEAITLTGKQFNIVYACINTLKKSNKELEDFKARTGIEKESK